MEVRKKDQLESIFVCDGLVVRISVGCAQKNKSLRLAIQQLQDRHVDAILYQDDHWIQSFFILLHMDIFSEKKSLFEFFFFFFENKSRI